MSPRQALSALLLLATMAAPAAAGPPYLTDDPVPTDLTHWEIYAFTAAQGHGSALDDDLGVDLNYGAAKDLQLTATLPLGFAHEPSAAWRAGTADLELAAKYRFVHDQHSGISVAAFPRAILPTSSLEHGEKVRLLLPVWAEKDFAGGTSLFGGGGYEVNPGSDNRDFWQAGAAITRDINDRLSVGGELNYQGRDTVDGASLTSAGAGAILKLSERNALLVSAGPTWSGRRTDYHAYAALGVVF